jgi:hypothetical protein
MYLARKRFLPLSLNYLLFFVAVKLRNRDCPVVIVPKAEKNELRHNSCLEQSCRGRLSGFHGSICHKDLSNQTAVNLQNDQ